MNIHSAIKFGTKTNIKVSPSHKTSAPEQSNDTSNDTSEQKTHHKTNHPPKQSQNLDQNHRNTDDTTSAVPMPNTPKAPTKTTNKVDKPNFKVVDLSIAGSSHRITCPIDEVAQLEQAGTYINDKIRELRRAIKGKNPSNEELLVLTCLELYDQCQSLNNDRKNQILANERAKALIEKITKDARSVL